MPSVLERPVVSSVTSDVPTGLDHIQYQALFRLLQAKAFQRGHFVLASGKTSTYYMDCRMATLSAQGASLIGDLFYQLLQPYHIDAVGGVALGAAPMVTAISTASVAAGQALDGFLIRKESKGYGTGRQIEGHLQPWMRVAIVEDVVTSGGSLIRGIEAVQTAYPSVEIVTVVSIVDREAGGKAAIEALGIPFQSLYSINAFLTD